jgi:ketosteroid isomerase-like protein
MAGETETVTLLRYVYAAYRDKRLADVLARLTDDFVFTLHLPADAMPGAGVPQGKAETAKLLEGLMATYDFLAYEPGEILVSGDRAAIQPRIRYRHKVTGQVIETTLGHFWIMRGDKAAQLDEYHDVERVQAYLARVEGKGSATG